MSSSYLGIRRAQWHNKTSGFSILIIKGSTGHQQLDGLILERADEGVDGGGDEGGDGNAICCWR